MASYHLYHFKDRMLVGSDDVEAEDDADAARIAAGSGRGDIVEIWNGSSRVRIVRPGGAWNAGAAAPPEAPVRDPSPSPAG